MKNKIQEKEKIKTESTVNDLDTFRVGCAVVSTDYL